MLSLLLLLWLVTLKFGTKCVNNRLDIFVVFVFVVFFIDVLVDVLVDVDVVETLLQCFVRIR